MESKFYR